MFGVGKFRLYGVHRLKSLGVWRLGEFEVPRGHFSS